MAPHLLMAGILTANNFRPSAKLEPRFCFSHASNRACLPSRGGCAVGPQEVGRLDEVEQVAAVRMVALGCAHEQGIGRSCACGGGIQHTRNICHGVALNRFKIFPLKSRVKL